MKVKGESEVAQSCLALSDPMDCSLPGSSIRGLFQARVLEWGAIAVTLDVLKETTVVTSTPTTQILVSNTILQLKKVGLPRQMTDARIGIGSIQDLETPHRARK